MILFVDTNLVKQESFVDRYDYAKTVDSLRFYKDQIILSISLRQRYSEDELIDFLNKTDNNIKLVLVHEVSNHIDIFKLNNIEGDYEIDVVDFGVCSYWEALDDFIREWTGVRHHGSEEDLRLI